MRLKRCTSHKACLLFYAFHAFVLFAFHAFVLLLLLLLICSLLGEYNGCFSAWCLSCFSVDQA